MARSSTKQPTAELVQYLIDRGYLDRVPDPTDRRARLLVLTHRGNRCTQAARSAAERTVGQWRERLTPEQADGLRDGLAAAVAPGRLRPTW